ncbi:MAG: hypothetical protein H6Q59_1374 [Firmicutes bacterium]|nr:hypothetical protein [Bacillota bacterium]
MRDKRPVLVTFIVDLNILNCFLLFISFFPEFIERFGITVISSTPLLSRDITKVLMIIILVIISYGLLKMKKWGYWSMVAYNMFFLIVAMLVILCHWKVEQFNPSLGAPIMGLYINLSAKRYFMKEKKA